jgi:ActR/RegA family two-component response regulator
MLIKQMPKVVFLREEHDDKFLNRMVRSITKRDFAYKG